MQTVPLEKNGHPEDREKHPSEAPSLLGQLLKKEVGSILVKGEPGTGKTTLALELLALYKRGVYVSTRVSLEQLIEHQKELSRLFEDGAIIEMGMQKASPKNDSYFFDSRYSDPRDFLNSLLEVVLKIAKPLIILDSWDSIATITERTERLKVEQGISFIAGGHDAKVLFISEEPNMTTTDYLVDAVVTLKNEIRDGNRFRRIEWNKLRGSAIPLWSTLYTLDGGRFTPIITDALLTIPSPPFKLHRPIPHGETYYSSGSKDLDDFFGGGIPKKRHILFELGRYVSSFEAFNPLASMMRMNFIANGGSAILIPSSGSAGSQLQILYRHLDAKDVEARFRAGYFGNSVGSSTCHFELDSSSWEKSCEIIGRVAKEIKGPEGRPCIYSISSEIIGHVFEHDHAVRFFQRVIQRVRASEDVLLSVAPFGSSLGNELSSMCDICVKIEQVEGATVMHSVKPRSQLYNVKSGYSGEYLTYRLKPLV